MLNVLSFARVNGYRFSLARDWKFITNSQLPTSFGPINAAQPELLQKYAEVVASKMRFHLNIANSGLLGLHLCPTRSAEPEQNPCFSKAGAVI